MNKQHNIAVIISLLVIIGAIGLSACASIASAEPQDGLESQVSTAVAATLVQYRIETEVAIQSAAMASEPVALAQATQPPAPTPTLAPTATAQPTAAPTAVPAQPTLAAPTPTTPPTPAAPAAPPPPASGPTITADENTNCRVGPSTGYTVVTYFSKGSQSTVQGRDAGKDWWYIVNPNQSSGYCWVWDGSTTVYGDTSTVPVVAAPAAPPKASNLYDDYYYACNPYASYYGYNFNNCNYGYNYNACVNYPYNNYWQNCNPYKWGACKPYVNCTCKPVYKNPYKNPCGNPCKKSNCPPLTQVNYKNYCNKYPKCCGEEN